MAGDGYECDEIMPYALTTDTFCIRYQLGLRRADHYGRPPSRVVNSFYPTLVPLFPAIDNATNVHPHCDPPYIPLTVPRFHSPTGFPYSILD